MAESEFETAKSSGYIEVTGKSTLTSFILALNLADKTNTHSQFLWHRKNSYGSDVSSDPIGMSTSMEDSTFLNGDYLLGKRQVRSPRSSNAGLSKFPCSK